MFIQLGSKVATRLYKCNDEVIQFLNAVFKYFAMMSVEIALE